MGWFLLCGSWVQKMLRGSNKVTDAVLLSPASHYVIRIHLVSCRVSGFFHLTVFLGSNISMLHHTAIVQFHKYFCWLYFNWLAVGNLLVTSWCVRSLYLLQLTIQTKQITECEYDFVWTNHQDVLVEALKEKPIPPEIIYSTIIYAIIYFTINYLNASWLGDSWSLHTDETHCFARSRIQLVLHSVLGGHDRNIYVEGSYSVFSGAFPEGVNILVLGFLRSVISLCSEFTTNCFVLFNCVF